MNTLKVGDTIKKGDDTYIIIGIDDNDITVKLVTPKLVEINPVEVV